MHGRERGQYLALLLQFSLVFDLLAFRFGRGTLTLTLHTFLFGPLGLLKRGHDIEIKPGQTITAYLDQDADLAIPLAPPPQVD